LLGLAQGDSPYEVTERLRVSRQSLDNWTYRFRDRSDADRSDRLADAPPSGRPCTARGIIDPLGRVRTVRLMQDETIIRPCPVATAGSASK
jgi:hypothetical protein